MIYVTDTVDVNPTRTTQKQYPLISKYNYKNINKQNSQVSTVLTYLNNVWTILFWESHN